MKKLQQIESPAFSGNTQTENKVNLLTTKWLNHAQRFAREYPYLLDNSTRMDRHNFQKLCASTENNIILSLLVLTNKKEFQRYFSKKLGFVPGNVESPFEIKTNVSFQVIDIKRNKTKEIKQKAERVLVKRAFGAESGLVLSGRFAGLVLNFGDEYSPELEHLPLADRYMNNNRVEKGHCGYGLLLSRDEFFQVDPMIALSLGDVSKYFPEITFNNHLDDNPQLTHTLDHLAFLLKKLKIQFNQDEVAYKQLLSVN